MSTETLENEVVVKPSEPLLSKRRKKLITDPLDALGDISGIYFKWLDGFEHIHTSEGEDVGVIAQDVQEIAPELIKESNWGTKEEPKMRLSIYQTDLQYALMKCIQEQQALITQLTNRITALEAK